MALRSRQHQRQICMSMPARMQAQAERTMRGAVCAPQQCCSGPSSGIVVCKRSIAAMQLGAGIAM